MIQGTAGISAQYGYGSESSARLGAQSGRRAGSVSASGSSEGIQAQQLTPAEQQQIQRLEETDRKVRAHEQAHVAVGADLVRGGVSFSYQTGPDNKRYAVGGEVSIDTSPGRTPEETIPKAQHIQATALAPADPSAQDHSVAAQAVSMENEARVELALQRRQAAVSSESAGSNFYSGVARSDADKSMVGAELDFFA